MYNVCSLSLEFNGSSPNVREKKMLVMMMALTAMTHPLVSGMYRITKCSHTPYDLTRSCHAGSGFKHVRGSSVAQARQNVSP